MKQVPAVMARHEGDPMRPGGTLSVMSAAKLCGNRAGIASIGPQQASGSLLKLS
jgi:hypothetical protein